MWAESVFRGCRVEVLEGQEQICNSNRSLWWLWEGLARRAGGGWEEVLRLWWESRLVVRATAETGLGRFLRTAEGPGLVSQPKRMERFGVGEEPGGAMEAGPWAYHPAHHLGAGRWQVSGTHKMQPLVLALPLCTLEQVPEIPHTSVSMSKMDKFVTPETWGEFGWKFVTSDVGYKEKG